jgi:hypothetical protein
MQSAGIFSFLKVKREGREEHIGNVPSLGCLVCNFGSLISRHTRSQEMATSAMRMLNCFLLRDHAEDAESGVLLLLLSSAQKLMIPLVVTTASSNATF